MTIIGIQLNLSRCDRGEAKLRSLLAPAGRNFLAELGRTSEHSAGLPARWTTSRYRSGRYGRKWSVRERIDSCPRRGDVSPSSPFALLNEVPPRDFLLYHRASGRGSARGQTLSRGCGISHASVSLITVDDRTHINSVDAGGAFRAGPNSTQRDVSVEEPYNVATLAGSSLDHKNS